MSALGDRVIDALARYLAQPVQRYRAATTADARPLAAILDRGDVLLSEGNTRVAALVKRITRSTWSHVSMYVGPLEEGPDPPCIVEADIAAGVRSIRLSELDARQVRVLRRIGLNDKHRHQLADWVVSRIGGEYDLAHAWTLGRNLLRLPSPRRLQSQPGTIVENATRFICCSLMAHAFALVGYPISQVETGISPADALDYRNLTPADFERAPVFEVVRPISNAI